MNYLIFNIIIPMVISYVTARITLKNKLKITQSFNDKQKISNSIKYVRYCGDCNSDNCRRYMFNIIGNLDEILVRLVGDYPEEITIYNGSNEISLNDTYQNLNIRNGEFELNMSNIPNNNQVKLEFKLKKQKIVVKKPLEF